MLNQHPGDPHYQRNPDLLERPQAVADAVTGFSG
jgi:hypothetical protein